MFTKKFWRDAAERAISTAAEAVIGVIIADQVNVLTLDWQNLGGFAAGGALLSLLKALAAAKTVGSRDSASLDPSV
jgi:hypothetical protein